MSAREYILFLVSATSIFEKLRRRTVVIKQITISLNKLPKTLQHAEWDAPVCTQKIPFPLGFAGLLIPPIEQSLQGKGLKI